jgi:hypothetical protein
MKQAHLGGPRAALATDAAMASGTATHPLIGTWRVTSARSSVMGPNGEESFDEKYGYLIITPDHRIMVIVADPEQVASAKDAVLAPPGSVVAYTGRFELAPDHYKFHADYSTSRVGLGGPFTRYYEIDGDNLTVRTPVETSFLKPGKQVQTVLRAVRDK